MNKILIILFSLIAFAGTALAIGPTLPRDGDGAKVQAPSWDATLSENGVTNVSTNFTITGKVW